MTIKERINEVFEKFNIGLKAEETALESQAVLENGTIIYTDAESFEEGGDVYIINEEGERIPLPQGDYTLADGALLVVSEGGKIGKAPARADGKEGSEGGEGKVAKGNPAKVKSPDAKAAPAKKPAAKKPAKSKKSEDEKTEDMEDPINEEAIVALINKILDERFPAEEVVEEAAEEVVEEEELSTEEPTEEVELEMEITLETLKEQLSAQAEELTTLKAEAASEGVKRAVPSAPKMEAIDLSSLSTEGRIKALFNQFNS